MCLYLQIAYMTPKIPARMTEWRPKTKLFLNWPKRGQTATDQSAPGGRNRSQLRVSVTSVTLELKLLLRPPTALPPLTESRSNAFLERAGHRGRSPNGCRPMERVGVKWEGAGFQPPTSPSPGRDTGISQC